MNKYRSKGSKDFQEQIGERGKTRGACSRPEAAAQNECPQREATTGQEAEEHPSQAEILGLSLFISREEQKTPLQNSNPRPLPLDTWRVQI